LRITVSALGMTMPIATIKIAKISDIKKPKTVLLCPQCGSKPTYFSRYVCECGLRVRHWSGLKRVVQGTMEEIVKTRLNDSKTVDAKVFVMSGEEFSQYADITYAEYGLVVSETTSANNLRKLIIASKELGYVVLIRFNDTYEERICVLDISLSGRVILRELIPLNLVDLRETLKIDLSEIREYEVNEAKRLVEMLPKATEKELIVHDYRTIGIGEEVISPKVVQLERIVKKIKAKA